MIVDFSKTKIFIRPGRTDMRKAINGLSLIVEREMDLDPFSGYLFLFTNRQRTLIKALYWDKNGFWLFQKRLEKHKFPWLSNDEKSRELTYENLKFLLSGIDFFRAHEELKYSQVG